MSPSDCRRRLLACAALLLPPLAPAAGAGPAGGLSQALRTAAAPPAAAYFGDHALQCQDGRTVRFYSDLLAHRFVLVNAVATRDDYKFCEWDTQRLVQARAALGARFGRDVFFVTLTTDPARDTVPVLREFARRHGAEHPGWQFVTGAPGQLQPALASLGYRLLPEHRAPLHYVLGNERTHRWRRLHADVAPPTIVAAITELLAHPAR